MSRTQFDDTRSHIRVERARNGWFAVTGAIGHSDLIDMTPIPEELFRIREQAMSCALQLAGHFSLPEVVVIV